ncbi:MAG: class I SAM-dependent methyltransferase, partial [Gemmatimonadales bacterium]
MTEWFEEWFSETYLHLYPHRDDAEAEQLVGLLAHTLPWRPGLLALDVGCGAGRHMVALERAGARAIGLDLSAGLLRQARLASRAPLVRADMRELPVRPASMDITLNLFTSFGYFDDDAEHRRAMAEMVATVRPGGWFVLDYLNADRVRETLVPEEDATLAGARVHIRRRLEGEGHRVVKEIGLADGRRFLERVRLFEPPALEDMISAAGGVVRMRFGDYKGGPLGHARPRTLLIAERE